MLADVEYLRLAYAEATKSIDPSTQNGAVIVAPWGEVIGAGHNRFASGLTVTEVRLADRGQKYPRTTHAEEASIWDAVRNGYHKVLPHSTMYIAWYACDKCAVHILESGIRRIVGHRQHPGVLQQHSKWAQLVEVGLDMLREGGVECCYHDDGGRGLECQPLRLDYKYWTP